MRRDPKAVYDGFQTVLRGVNSGTPPNTLRQDQFSWAINTTFRGFYAKNRPGWKKRTLRFLNASGAVDTTLKNNFEDGLFSGASTFERRNQLVAAIGGRLFRIRVDTWDVLDISTTGDLNPNNRNRSWFTEAEGFLIVQDGQSAPWIYDGAFTRRSDTFGTGGTKEIPTGTAMVYSGGRLDVALIDERSFVVGDIAGGPSGTQQYNFRDAVLKFTENEYLNEGGAFSVPINAGKLTAFRPIAQTDTSQGQGPTQVFTTNAVFSLNTPVDRTTWKDVTFPIQTVSLIQSGSLSDRATQLVNGDIWYRSLDGIRSFMVARRDHGTWVNAPFSQEVIRGLDKDDPSLLDYASFALFDNRLFCTVNPYRDFDHGICHRGFVVLDFAPVSFMGGRSAPAWEGLWTGLNILQVMSGTFNGEQRAFVFALNATKDIELWELTLDDDFDNNGTTDVRIEWSIETGSYSFADAGFDQKELGGGQLWVDSLKGTVDFVTQFRADQDPCWHDWQSWNLCATTTTCGTQGSRDCVTPQNLHPQYRKPFNLSTPLRTCDETTNKPQSIGSEFQTRLTITGPARLKRFRLIAHQVQEDVVTECISNESCKTLACCQPNDFDYSIS